MVNYSMLNCSRKFSNAFLRFVSRWINLFQVHISYLRISEVCKVKSPHLYPHLFGKGKNSKERSFTASNSPSASCPMHRRPPEARSPHNVQIFARSIYTANTGLEGHWYKPNMGVFPFFCFRGAERNQVFFLVSNKGGVCLKNEKLKNNHPHLTFIFLRDAGVFCTPATSTPHTAW